MPFSFGNFMHGIQNLADGVEQILFSLGDLFGQGVVQGSLPLSSRLGAFS